QHLLPDSDFARNTDSKDRRQPPSRTSADRFLRHSCYNILVSEHPLLVNHAVCGNKFEVNADVAAIGMVALHIVKIVTMGVTTWKCLDLRRIVHYFGISHQIHE
ncbi:hypothetical protein PF011_g31551, partial [Phytophthora fragariae]